MEGICQRILLPRNSLPFLPDTVVSRLRAVCEKYEVEPAQSPEPRQGRAWSILLITHGEHAFIEIPYCSSAGACLGVKEASTLSPLLSSRLLLRIWMLRASSEKPGDDSLTHSSLDTDSRSGKFMCL